MGTIEEIALKSLRLGLPLAAMPLLFWKALPGDAKPGLTADPARPVIIMQVPDPESSASAPERAEEGPSTDARGEMPPVPGGDLSVQRAGRRVDDGSVRPSPGVGEVAAESPGRVDPILPDPGQPGGERTSRGLEDPIQAVPPTSSRPRRPFLEGQDEAPGTPVPPPTSAEGSADAHGPVTTTGPQAVARYRGVASPGLKITLDGSESRGEGLSFVWIQTEGPKVRAVDLHRPRVELIVPGEATKLAFTLVVSGTGGMDSVELPIPLDLRPRAILPPVVRADAGDDQVGLVGHRITLNGIRSTPRDRSEFRWLQVAGPPVASLSRDGCFCSFIPTAPGQYRFVLVTAADGAISEPDEVLVSVAAGLPRGQDLPATAAAPAPIEVVTRGALGQVPGGAAAGLPLAATFEDIAARMPLYESYNGAQREIALRLGALLPADPMARDAWNRYLFPSLTAAIVDALRRDGLDLTRQEVRAARLTEAQKAQLSRVFAAIAAGCRAASGSDPGDEAGPADGSLPSVLSAPARAERIGPGAG